MATLSALLTTSSDTSLKLFFHNQDASTINTDQNKDKEMLSEYFPT
jgi:hypothetical protein